MYLIPQVVWEDIIRGYWTRLKGSIEFEMWVVLRAWVEQYGGPKTGLCLNVLHQAYPGRTTTQYRQLGEGIFAKWAQRGAVSTSNGYEDMFSQFFWNAYLNQYK